MLARAKINLTLHVGPVGADGYHPLESLVVFANIGDQISIAQTSAPLTIGGPFASALEQSGNLADNLVLRAARAVCSGEPPSLHLVKNLPVASGIGGGSADAAATMRLLSADIGQAEFALAETLGADVPVCLLSRTSIMRGRGEKLTPLHGHGQIHAVLVNLGAALSTGLVFKKFDDQPQSDVLDTGADGGLMQRARAGRNDLQMSAIQIEPRISDVLSVIRDTSGCVLARMSGSGATCFGLYSDELSARRAAQNISQSHPNWWCKYAILGDPE